MSRIPHNADYTKSYNRNLILKLLRKAPLSRADLARTSGLTRASVSIIADELIMQNIISELPPAESRRGRTPLPLAICSGKYCAIGIYLNREGCHAGIVDLDGSLLYQQSIFLPEREPLQVLQEELQKIASLPQISENQILGIGISAPGPLDPESGSILNPPGFSAWHHTEIVQVLSQAVGKPAWLENNACSLARHYCESNGLENALLLLVDSGIGSGVVSGGKLLYSAGGFTSELGHTTISYNGRACSCGGKGCLEAYAAIPNLLHSSSYQNWMQLIEAVKAGEEEALFLLKEEASFLSAGITNLSNIINVESIILTGDICYGSDWLLPLLSQELEGKFLGSQNSRHQLVTLPVTEQLQISAAATVVFQNFLNTYL